MSSSDSSELPVPGESSDSLDTTIGYHTEIGRETVIDSSSSGAQGLSDPALESSDSSRPQSTTHAPPTIRGAAPVPLPPDPDLWQEALLLQDGAQSRPHLEAAEGLSTTIARGAAHTAHAAEGARPRLEQSTGAVPRTAPPPAGHLSGVRQPHPALPGDMIELLIRQMERQQQQQMEQQQQQHQMMLTVLQNLGLQSQAAVRYPPQLPIPPPLPERPDPPREVNTCPECALEEPHICQYSQRGGSSAGGSQRAGMVPPQVFPPSLPGAPNQLCPVAQWVNDEDSVHRPEQQNSGPAGIEPQLSYAGSVVSTTHSKTGMSIHSSLRQLQRAMDQMRRTEGKGEKLISFAQKEMSELNKNLPRNWTQMRT